MTDDALAVLCGPVALTNGEVRERIAHAVRSRRYAAGRMEPILDSDRVGSLVTALAVRACGGIPLLGDDRWDAALWASLRRIAEQARPQSAIAWATFSSGSTGAPRVILRSEPSWASSFSAVSALLELTPRDVVYLPAPLSSSMSLFSAAHARSAGAAILLPRAHTVSDADLASATVFHGTPTALRSVLERSEGGVRHGLRAALVGGAQLHPALRSRAEAAGIRVISYYGAAELSFVAVDADGHGLRPFPGAELRARDGELWVRSPYFAAGYLGSTRGSLRRDDEGWATVGDLVDGDPVHGVRLRGRRDGAILTAGATVVPEDVEAALESIDGVTGAVVLGLPNDGAGSLVCALLETAEGLPVPSARDLRDQAAARLAPSHLPRRWFWTEQIPRTSSGKPARAQIHESVANGKMARIA